MSLRERRQVVERCVDSKLASGDYADVLDLCRQYELDAADADLTGETCPLYSVQLACCLVLNQLDHARFLWKRIPKTVKTENELKSLWEIGKALWQHKIADVYVALASYTWSPRIQPLVSALAERFRARVLRLISSAYSVISKKDCAALLGLPAEQAEALVVRRENWGVEGDMYKPVPPPPSTFDTTGVQQLQALTQYATFLEIQ